MTSAKIRIKVGSMELEYEGDPSFLTGGIEALLVTMGDLSSHVPPAPDPAHAAPINGATQSTSVSAFNFSTNTISANFDAKSGTDVVICAMAQLELVQGKASSNRAEILAEMKTATTYFKETMSNNLTKSFSTLLKSKRINQVAKETYSLSAAERKQVEAKVAGIE